MSSQIQVHLSDKIHPPICIFTSTQLHEVLQNIPSLSWICYYMSNPYKQHELNVRFSMPKASKPAWVVTKISIFLHFLFLDRNFNVFEISFVFCSTCMFHISGLRVLSGHNLSKRLTYYFLVLLSYHSNRLCQLTI